MLDETTREIIYLIFLLVGWVIAACNKHRVEGPPFIWGLACYALPLVLPWLSYIAIIRKMDESKDGTT